MNIIGFIEEFPNDQSCKTLFKLNREHEGVLCKKCRFRTTLRSGTMLESSKLSFRIWYLGIAFMSYSKKGLSALELQRQLGYKNYQPIWLIMDKIRVSMGKRDALYNLKDMVEYDEAYFSIATKDPVNLKRAKGSQKKQNVAVMAESTLLEDIKTGKKQKQCRYFKMKVLPNHKSDSVDQSIEDNILNKGIVFSDKSTSYVNISDFVEVHVTEKSNRQTTISTLKWVHIAISNAKRTLLGIYHKIKGKYLQNYLDEFCYKLNRRYFGENLFDRLIISVISCGK